MKRMILWGLAVSLATSPALSRERKPPEGFANPSAVIAAEIAFAQLAQSKGQWTAFRTTATKDAVMFVPQMVLTQDHLKGKADPAVPVKWQPHQVWSSCDGSIGVTRGAWQSDKATGWFSTIWQRQKKGDYKWIMDQGDETPMALDAPDMIVAKVADCPPGYRGAKHKRKDAKGKIALGDPAFRAGKSDDGTLTWEVRVAPDGARNFTMSLKLDGQLTPVQVVEVAAPPAK
jgi:hypothetical protein